jgi:DNA replication protein DnaC
MTEKDKSTVLLEYSLKRLKLPTMLREYAALATVCQKDRSDYPTYLLRLTERELLDREKRAAERRIKDANFPVIKTIDTYDFGASPRSTSRWSGSFCGGSTWTKKKTCSSSETREPAKPTWSVL